MLTGQLTSKMSLLACENVSPCMRKCLFLHSKMSSPCIRKCLSLHSKNVSPCIRKSDFPSFPLEIFDKSIIPHVGKPVFLTRITSSRHGSRGGGGGGGGGGGFWGFIPLSIIKNVKLMGKKRLALKFSQEIRTETRNF